VIFFREFTQAGECFVTFAEDDRVLLRIAIADQLHFHSRSFAWFDFVRWRYVLTDSSFADADVRNHELADTNSNAPADNLNNFTG